MSNEVLSRSTDGVLRLTLNRPEALNALTNEVLAKLLGALATAAEDTAVRVVVIDGAGDKAFCSGIDLAQRSALSFDEKGDQSRQVLTLVKTARNLPQPILVALHGHCLGAGLELATACDVRLCADNAKLGFPEVTLGAYPGGGGAVLLPRLIGRARAIEWLLSARRIDANEALSMGLVSRVVPSEALEDTVMTMSRHIASLAPLAVRALKASIDATLDRPLGEAFDIDQRLRRPLDGTQDYQEALKAFKEKRAPVFVGR
jgi:enoyl-CoA hydratase/carnithine racemase